MRNTAIFLITNYILHHTRCVCECMCACTRVHVCVWCVCRHARTGEKATAGFSSCDTAAEARAFACCSVLRGKAVLRGFDVIYFPRAGDVTDVASSPWEMACQGISLS